jgi:hypothetical protein
MEMFRPSSTYIGVEANRSWDGQGSFAWSIQDGWRTLHSARGKDRLPFQARRKLAQTQHSCKNRHGAGAETLSLFVDPDFHLSAIYSEIKVVILEIIFLSYMRIA